METYDSARPIDATGSELSASRVAGSSTARVSGTAVSPGLLVTRLLRCGRTVSLQLRGVLNWRTAAQFQRDVAAGLTGPCRRVVLDLTGVEYVGGDVLRALVDLHEQLSERGIELRLVIPEGSRCARSVALTGLDRRIPTYGRPDQAWHHRQRSRRTHGAGDVGASLPPNGRHGPAV